MLLHSPTLSGWLDAVTSDFDAFLLDHAACERKASATALTFVSHYPDRRELVVQMIDLAREELEHFKQVHQHIAERGLQLAPHTKDSYVLALRDLLRRGRDYYFLDRLLVAGIIEARGCERFQMVAGGCEPSLQGFYRKLATSEAKHRELFVGLARMYFPEAQVQERLEQLLDAESEIVSRLPLRAALH
jgi:tRNA-(ms[2]io[6]A)-hydroxylase